MQIIEKNKNLMRFFIGLFMVSLVIVNWDDISWAFNYKFILDGLSSSLVKENYSVSAEVGSQIVEKEKTIEQIHNSLPKEGSIEIPKIGITAPIIFAEKNDLKSLKEYLDRGVLLYPGSALPGDIGTAIILGHSASPSWPKVKYDWVFGKLNELEPDDKIFIFIENKKIIYEVNNKIFLEKGAEIPSDEKNPGSTLYLVSCWPPGRDVKRIVVKATLTPEK